MKLSSSQLDVGSLRVLGERAVSLLVLRNYAELVSEFGYALAHGRDAAAVLQEDFARAAASPHVIPIKDKQPVSVSYFQPNSSGLFALVEGTVPLTASSGVLLELIVTGTSEDAHITVEGISGASA